MATKYIYNYTLVKKNNKYPQDFNAILNTEITNIFIKTSSEEILIKYNGDCSCSTEAGDTRIWSKKELIEILPKAKKIIFVATKYLNSNEIFSPCYLNVYETIDYSKTITDLEDIRIVKTFPSGPLSNDGRQFQIFGMTEKYEVDMLDLHIHPHINKLIENLWKENYEAGDLPPCMSAFENFIFKVLKCCGVKI